jgi:hypothetical protein
MIQYTHRIKKFCVARAVHKITPWSVVLEKLIVAERLKNYRLVWNLKFYAVFTTPRLVRGPVYDTRKLSWELPSLLPLGLSGRVNVIREGILLTVKKTLLQYTVIINDLSLLTYCEFLC